MDFNSMYSLLQIFTLGQMMHSCCAFWEPKSLNMTEHTIFLCPISKWKRKTQSCSKIFDPRQWNTSWKLELLECCLIETRRGGEWSFSGQVLSLIFIKKKKKNIYIHIYILLSCRPVKDKSVKNYILRTITKTEQIYFKKSFYKTFCL